MVKKTQSAYDTIKHGISKTWQSHGVPPRIGGRTRSIVGARQPRPGDDEGMRLATACSQASNRLQARPLEGDRVPDAINSIDICRRLVVP